VTKVQKRSFLRHFLCKMMVFSYVSRVNGIVHYAHPTFEGGHLEKSEVSVAYVVKVNARVDPLVVCVGHALRLVVDRAGVEHVAFAVHALGQGVGVGVGRK
jgi:hypothetical protein